MNKIVGQNQFVGSASNEHIEKQEVIQALKRIDDLKFFLQTAPTRWNESQVIRRFRLNEEEGFVSCVYWDHLYYITGTDIVRCIAFKMRKFGRKIIDRKKFEEGIFSDLRALKDGSHAVLEEPRSPFLAFLHRNQCLKTQKKQKVFFWFNVPHDKLFADALERDLKREMANQRATTVSIADPALSLQYDQSVPLVKQITDLIESKGFRDEALYDSDGVALEDKIVPVSQGASQQRQEGEVKLDPHISQWPSNTETVGANNDEMGTPYGADDDFPLDYINPDLDISATTENFSFTGPEFVTYTHQPMMYVDPAMYMASPAGMYFQDDLLLDQATPVVPVMFSQQQQQNEQRVQAQQQAQAQVAQQQHQQQQQYQQQQQQQRSSSSSSSTSSSSSPSQQRQQQSSLQSLSSSQPAPQKGTTNQPQPQLQQTARPVAPQLNQNFAHPAGPSISPSNLWLSAGRTPTSALMRISTPTSTMFQPLYSVPTPVGSHMFAAPKSANVSNSKGVNIKQPSSSTSNVPDGSIEPQQVRYVMNSTPVMFQGMTPVVEGLDFDPGVPQMIPSYPTGLTPTVAGSQYVYYQSSPYYADIPIMPVSAGRPIPTPFRSPVALNHGGSVSMRGFPQPQAMNPTPTRECFLNAVAAEKSAKVNKSKKILQARFGGKDAVIGGGRVSKPNGNAPRLLNPTLQNLNLDSIFDEDGGQTKGEGEGEDAVVKASDEDDLQVTGSNDNADESQVTGSSKSDAGKNNYDTVELKVEEVVPVSSGQSTASTLVSGVNLNSFVHTDLS